MKIQARLLAFGVVVAITSCSGDGDEAASKELVILGAPIGGQVAVGGGFALYPEVHDSMGGDAACTEPYRWTNTNPAALDMDDPNSVGMVRVMAVAEGSSVLTVRCDQLGASVTVRVIAAEP